MNFQAFFFLANAVVDKRARSRGLGRQMAQICMRAAFTTDCHAMYLGAELTESDCPETGETVTQENIWSCFCLFQAMSKMFFLFLVQKQRKGLQYWDLTKWEKPFSSCRLLRGDVN